MLLSIYVSCPNCLVPIPSNKSWSWLETCWKAGTIEFNSSRMTIPPTNLLNCKNPVKSGLMLHSSSESIEKKNLKGDKEMSSHYAPHLLIISFWHLFPLSLSLFIRLLETSDPFVQLKSAQFLTLLLVSPTSSSKSSSSIISSPPSVLSKLLTFLTSSISLTAASDPSPSGYAEGNGPDIGIQLLEALLRTQEYREEVWKDDLKKMGIVPSKPEEGNESITTESSHGLIGGLVQILRTGLQNSSSSSSTSAFNSKNNSGANTPRNGTNGNSSSSSSSSGNNASSALAPPAIASGTRTPGAQGLAGPQMQYQCIFCLWLLTFNEEIAAELNT